MSSAAVRDKASAKKIAAALRAARRLDAVAGDSGGVLKDDDVWDLSMPAGPIRPKPSSTLTNQQKLELWFPPNRGGFGYAASRTGAAVFS